jgi:hypothetical protein
VVVDEVADLPEEIIIHGFISYVIASERSERGNPE